MTILTERLYYSSPFLTNWETEINTITEENDAYLVTLNATAFYPEGGGQPADVGFIDGIEIIDVIERDDEIYHLLPSPPTGSTVACEIDWNRRLDHMQQHTGQHLLSAVCIKLYDAHTVSFHLGTDSVTIDLAVPELSEKQLQQIESHVNQYIYDNIPLKKYVVGEDQLSALSLRKIPDVTDEIRIVEIKGIDTSACCGTHVMRTGELGLIKLLKTEKQKGNVRLHFKCGKRALSDYHASHSLLTQIANKFSTNRYSILETISKLENDNKQLQKDLELLKEQNDQYFAQELLVDNQEKVIIHTSQDRGFKEIQSLGKQLTNLTDRLVMLASLGEKKLIFSHNGSRQVHCGQLFKEHLSKYGGKGGGNATSAQAGFTSKDDLLEFIAFFKKDLLENHV